METIVLQNDKMKAVFAHMQGMNLVELKKGNIDFIDPNTLSLFEERLAGLGSLIGPHFYHRKPDQIPSVPKESAFPHIAKIKAKGVREPFSHGIARYVPWKVETSTKDSVHATLSGKDLIDGMSLASLEGFSFEMSFKATLLENGLAIDYSVESEKPSVIGLHYYYTLPVSGGIVRSAIEPIYRFQDKWVEIPSSLLDQDGNLLFDGAQEADFGFISKKKGSAEILYTNPEFALKISFETEDGSWQLYRPKDASYICIEPLSSKDPKDPHLKTSFLKFLIEES